MFDLDIELYNDSSIQDVLLCWDSGEKNSADVEDTDSIMLNFEDLECEEARTAVAHEASEEYDPHSPHGKQVMLEELMKKYPSFIPPPPPEIPIRRRPRPLCTFVNFMGTRKGPPRPGTAIFSSTQRIQPFGICTSASPFPTDMPNSFPRPATRTIEELAPLNLPLVSPTMSPISRRPIVNVTPLPVLLTPGRITTPVCEYNFKAYSHEASRSFPPRPVVVTQYHF